VKDASSGETRVIKAFEYPSYHTEKAGWNHTPEGGICRLPGCKRCPNGPETATLHVDCYNLYNSTVQGSDKLARLFNTASWMYPWKDAPALHLEPSKVVDNCRALRVAAHACGMPGLLGLPLELADLVSEFAADSAAFRLASVLDIIDYTTADESKSMWKVSIQDIASWERGTEPVLKQGATDKPFIHLVIDSRGLREISRLSEIPAPSEARYDDLAFVLEHELCFRDVTVDFDMNLGHLNMPDDMPHQFKLWDRPYPPPLEESLIYHTAVASQSMALRTIDLDACSGLTFFMTSKDTYAIHAHTSAQPTARETFDKLSPRHQEISSWVYVPFSPYDQVQGFGVRRSITDGGHLLNNPAYLFRTELAGDFSVGSDEKRTSRHTFTLTGPGTKLVHNIAEGNPLAIIGAFPQNREHTVPIDGSQLHPIATPRVGRGCFSTAHLDGAAYLTVFEDPVTRYCKGIIIDYENGGARAIGQCRIGDDPFVVYENPSKLCLAPAGDRRQSMRWGFGEVFVVGVGSKPVTVPMVDNGRRLNWCQYDLRGEMQFWFDRWTSQVLIAA
jgi:hypothetical protein